MTPWQGNKRKEPRKSLSAVPISFKGRVAMIMQKVAISIVVVLIIILTAITAYTHTSKTDRHSPSSLTALSSDQDAAFVLPRKFKYLNLEYVEKFMNKCNHDVREQQIAEGAVTSVPLVARFCDCLLDNNQTLIDADDWDKYDNGTETAEVRAQVDYLLMQSALFCAKKIRLEDKG